MDTDKPSELVRPAYTHRQSVEDSILALHTRVERMWQDGTLSPDRLRLCCRRTRISHVYHSNRIEGNSLTLDQTRRVIIKQEKLSHISSIDLLEAKNLASALDYAYEFALDPSYPVTQTVIRQLHALILSGIQTDAGSYRITQNKIAGSRFKTPDALDVPLKMGELSDYIAAATASDSVPAAPPVVSAAAAHAWLAQIHPFTDGNGRTTRALMNLMLVRNGYTPCLIMANDRERYIESLEESQTGDLTGLLELIVESANRDIGA